MRQIKNWYKLLEGTGLVANDDGPGNAVGALSADVTWCPFYHPPGTPYGYKGVVIGASESRIVSPAAAGFNPTEGSIEMLVRPNWDSTDGLVHTFWDTYDGANRRFLLQKTSAGITTLYTDNTSRGSFTFAWSALQLYHIVLNWGTNQLFINGVLVHTFSAGGLGLGASTLYIGDRYTSPNQSLSGIIYYFIARDVALTAAEIATFKAFFEKQYIPD